MTLSEYMKLPYRMEIVPDEEGGYVITFPELPGCITCGKTIESAISNAKDAKKTWIEAVMDEGQQIPKPDCLNDYSEQFRLWIPKNLHKQLFEQSKQKGISINQYCLYLLSKNDTTYS